MKNFTTFLIIAFVIGGVFGGCTFHEIGNYELPETRLPDSLPQNITGKVRYNYYDIQGESLATIWQSIKINSPHTEDDKTYASQAWWRLGWEYSHKTTSKGCAVDQVNVIADLIFLMPRWNRPLGTTDQVEEEWEDFELGLIDHENGHRDIAFEYAIQLMTALKEVPSQENCFALSEVLKTAGNKIIEACNKSNSDYDYITDHGYLQGASLGMNHQVNPFEQMMNERRSLTNDPNRQ